MTMHIKNRIYIYIYIFSLTIIYIYQVVVYDNQVVGIQHVFFIFKELIKKKKISTIFISRFDLHLFQKHFSYASFYKSQIH